MAGSSPGIGTVFGVVLSPVWSKIRSESEKSAAIVGVWLGGYLCCLRCWRGAEGNESTTSLHFTSLRMRWKDSEDRLYSTNGIELNQSRHLRFGDLPRYEPVVWLAGAVVGFLSFFCFRPCLFIALL